MMQVTAKDHYVWTSKINLTAQLHETLVYKTDSEILNPGQCGKTTEAWI